MGMFYGLAWKRCILQRPVLAWPELSWKAMPSCKNTKKHGLNLCLGEKEK